MPVIGDSSCVKLSGLSGDGSCAQNADSVMAQCTEVFGNEEKIAERCYWRSRRRNGECGVLRLITEIALK